MVVEQSERLKGVLKSAIRSERLLPSDSITEENYEERINTLRETIQHARIKSHERGRRVFG